ncbi:lysophospholipid acyltransferase family protein [Candidatus Avelusimicrobium alvi]|uniref:LpxL/LpxP family acyltransferase n=1 Tax=Candidatus Avelusimicrobium alvi TaxID=3416221 RepID=UPI003D122E3C
MDAYKEHTGRSLASKVKHRFMYALIFTGGRSLAYLFLYIVALFYSLSPAVSAKSRAYIARRFKPKSKWAFFKHTYLLNLTFGRTLVDRAALGILGRTGVSSTEEERELCRKLLAEGKGLILLSAHAGCWQLAVNLLDFLPVKKNVLYYRNPKDNDKTVAEHAGRAAPFAYINPAGPLGGVVEMMASLQRGEVLCAMADRVFGDEKNAVSVSFLGGRIRVPYSFYRLAAATGAPAAVMFFPWEGKGRFSTRTCGVIRVPELGAARENYVPFAQQFVDALEEFVIQYPYQFFNYFDLWENAPYATDHR